MNPWYIKERILWTRLYTFAPREFVFQQEDTLIVENIYKTQFAENGRYPPTQNGDIRSLLMLFTLMAMQN